MTIIINVKTKKEFKLLLDLLHKKGYRWQDAFAGDYMNYSLKDKNKINNYWKEHKSETVICIDDVITYGGVGLTSYNEKIEEFNEERIEKLLMLKHLGDEN